MKCSIRFFLNELVRFNLNEPIIDSLFLFHKLDTKVPETPQKHRVHI